MSVFFATTKKESRVRTLFHHLLGDDDLVGSPVDVLRDHAPRTTDELTQDECPHDGDDELNCEAHDWGDQRCHYNSFIGFIIIHVIFASFEKKLRPHCGGALVD